GVLSIRGMRRQDGEGQANKFHRVERSYGNFVRNFSLPDLVDDAKLEAVVKDGMLTLHLPKRKKAKPKANIHIQEETMPATEPNNENLSAVVSGLSIAFVGLCRAL